MWPSASSAMPSGAKPSRGIISAAGAGSAAGAIWPHTRRSCSEPSAAIVNAVRRPANVSATISVSPSIAMPFGNHRSSPSTDTVPSGSTRSRLVAAGSAKFMMSKPKLPV